MDAVWAKFAESLMIGSAYGGFSGRGRVSICASDITEDAFRHIRKHPLTLEEAQRRMGSIQGGVITKASWIAHDVREVDNYRFAYRADLNLTVEDEPEIVDLAEPAGVRLVHDVHASSGGRCLTCGISSCTLGNRDPHCRDLMAIHNEMASFGSRLSAARGRCYDGLYAMFEQELDKAIDKGYVGLSTLHLHVNPSRSVAESLRDHPPTNDEVRTRLGIDDDVPIELKVTIEDYEERAPHIFATLTVHPVTRELAPSARTMYRRVILVGEGAAGKDTIRNACHERGVRCDVSVTTRRPREGEVPGYTYDYLPEAEFLALRMADKLRESATFNKNRYGTRRASWDEPGVFILTPDKLDILTPEEHAESFVVHVTAPEDVRASRLREARGYTDEEIAERFAADAALFSVVPCDIVWDGTQPAETAAELIKAILKGTDPAV